MLAAPHPADETTVMVAVAVTVAAANPVLAGAEAVTVTVVLPAPMAVTTPAEETEAMLGLEDTYVTVGLGAPVGRETVGTSDCVCPTERLAEVGETVSAVIDGCSADTVTATVDVSVVAAKPPLAGAVAVTVIDAIPGDKAVMLPDEEAIATLGFVEP
jgi:hypothetical protein